MTVAVVVGPSTADDGVQAGRRVTFFNRYAPYYASNPTVSPDGSRLAFQLSVNGETEGEGDGLLVMTLP